ncbi:MAG: succinate dehydrogenase cytochrome b subunit [bacterium]|nr:succinate dehydrogenase cytochrome b subunit [bacterium]
MSRVLKFLTGTIGQKVLMGLTGLALIGFLATHMSANLLVFVGPGAYNAYSHSLTSNPLIYLAEAGLAALFVAHLVSGIRVWLRNRAARPVAYQMKKRAGHTSHKSLASTTMILTGLVLLVFVPLHIRMFKFGPHYETPGEPGIRDLHRLVIEDFQNPLLVAWYVLAMGVVGFHLWHGFGSAFDSLGVAHRPAIRRTGQIVALAIAGGFTLVPVVVFFTGGRL